MPHKKKKAGILTVATSLVGAGASAVSNGMYIEAGVFFAMSAGLFLAYEHLNIEEVNFAVKDAEKIADHVGEAVEDELNKKQ